MSVMMKENTRLDNIINALSINILIGFIHLFLLILLTMKEPSPLSDYQFDVFSLFHYFQIMIKLVLSVKTVMIDRERHLAEIQRHVLVTPKLHLAGWMSTFFVSELVLMTHKSEWYLTCTSKNNTNVNKFVDDFNNTIEK